METYLKGLGMNFTEAVAGRILEMQQNAATPRPSGSEPVDAARQRLVPKVAEAIAADAADLATFLLSSGIEPNTRTVATAESVWQRPSPFAGRVHTHDVITYGPPIWHLASLRTAKRTTERYDRQMETMQTIEHGVQIRGLGLLATGKMVDFDFISVRLPANNLRGKDVLVPRSTDKPVDGDLLVNRAAFNLELSANEQPILATWQKFFVSVGATLATGQPFTPRLSRDGNFMPDPWYN